MVSSEYPAQVCLTPPSRPVDTSVHIPGSKSITNRALLLAALGHGVSRLRDPLRSEDTIYMAAALRSLGVTIEDAANGDYIVHGVDGQFCAPADPLFVGNSGTTIRFLTAASCLAPPNADIVLDGVARMRERPIRDLLGALLTLGVNVESLNGHGCPPVRIRGGGLPGGACRLRGDVSSQFLSALLQVAPYAHKSVDIEIVGELISKPYVDITQAVMRSFHVDMENDGYRHLHVPSGQRYAAQDYIVEADASNASYFLAAAAVTGGAVTIENLLPGSIQGDIRFIEILEQMGCEVNRAETQISLAGPEQLSAISADLESMPDMAQTLAVVAAFADGSSRITGLASLRVKETDRLQAVARELPKLGVGVEEGRDYWVISPPKNRQWQAGIIETYDDHRMGMSFAVAGLRIPDVVIKNPGCVAKTFPEFWGCWERAFRPGSCA